MSDQTIRSRSSDKAATHPEALSGKKLITVASGKGGVGKTWFAITLSHALAQAGRKVLLFDGDLGLANIDIQLGLNPSHDLSEAVLGTKRFDEVVTKSPETGFDMVAGRSGSARMVNVRHDQISLLRHGLLAAAQVYDHVVLDLGAGVDRSIRGLAANSGPTMVITTEEPTAITDAYALIKLLHADRPGGDFRVVVNMCGGRAEGERTFAKLSTACENFLKVKPRLAGIITRDPNVNDTIRRQTPMLKRHPLSPASEDVARIARSLLAEGH